MIIKTIGNKFLSILFCLTITVGVFFSCAPDQVDIPIDDPNTPADGYMQLTFDLPGFQMPSSRPKTRAMTPEFERSIDKNRLHVFVFNEDNTFEYKAPVLVDSYTEDAEKKKATVTIQLVKSAEINSVVVLANYDLPTDLVLTEGITALADLYKQCTFSMPQDGKWKSDAHIPMWGKSEEIVVTENNTPDVNISLRRALARIDVGLNFTTTDDGKLSENAEGVPNFKIKEVKVFRTYNEGLVGSVNADFSVADIPEGAVRRKTDTPLDFTVTDGADSYLREIYLPPSDRPMKDNKVDAAQIHCVVIGGSFGDASGITYYRMDFADKYLPDGQAPNYMDIAGNYRYVFNITGVSGPGFATYDEALRATPSIDFEYELIAWDESIHEMHVQGKHHFGLDNREITLGAIRTAEETGNRRVIKYQTNYPISDADGITFEWAHPTDPDHPSVSPYFEAQWTGKGDKGEITITALTTNETNSVLTDVLQVKLGSFTIEVNVNQEYVNYKYTLNCETVEVHGTYRPGYALDPTKHYITLDIIAEDKSINNTEYIIETEPIHGIVFKGSGTFNVDENNLTVTGIILKGEGTLETPADARTEPFTVTIRSNSSAGSYCEATITPVIPTLRVLSLANRNTSYNYDISQSGGGAYKVLKSPNNFGANDNSIVKIEGLELIQGSTHNGTLEHKQPLSEKAYKLLRDGMEDEDGVSKYLADILYVGHDALYNMSDDEAKTLITYMNNGGVVMMFNEGGKPNNQGNQSNSFAGPTRLFKGLFPSANITMSYAGSNAVIPFVGNDFYKTGSEEEWNAFMYKLQADPILTGPFGDIKDKQWGEDISHATAVNKSAFPTQIVAGEKVISSDITIYSYITDLSDRNPDTSKDFVSGFKYETDSNADNLISFVYFGDGGFMSSNNNSTAVTPCPFWWNPTTMFPIAKPNYKRTGLGVYNSQAFCNTMAWAINRSLELKPKRDAAVGR